MRTSISITARPHRTVKVTINPAAGLGQGNAYELTADDAILWGKYLTEAGQYAKNDTERKWEITS